MDAASGSLLVGERLDDKYEIGEPLGQGGMGAVFRATHLGTTRTVAIKIIRPEFSNDPSFVERFRREAEALGRLRHPNVVDVTDFGVARTGGGLIAYLVMEYLDGCTLAEVLEEERRLPTSWVVDILDQACSAVDEAHRLGIVHRDLKPENIWLEPNRRGGYTVKVLDFGLATAGGAPVVGLSGASHSALEPAAAASAETRFTPAALTQAGAALGTPLYMSPEQCRGDTLDARSDVYSLGVVAYRMLAGRTPFDGDPADVIRRHLTTDAPALERGPGVPRRTAAVVMAALAKDPARRPQTAAGFGARLRATAEGTGALLRHAVALYSEHFPAFIGISVVAYAPLILLVGFINLIDRHILPARFAPPPSNVTGILLFLTMIAANLLGYFTASAAAAPIVVQLAVAPLREVKVGTAFSALARRWRTCAAATMAVIAMIVAGTVFFVLPGVAAAVAHALYAPVAMLEGATVRPTLRRARELARRAWSSVAVITAVQFALPVLVWAASVKSSFIFKLADDYTPKELGFNFQLSAGSSLYQLLSILITPLTAIMLAQLYLKTRYAGGEAITDAAARLDALEIPRSRWQARMRSRGI